MPTLMIFAVCEKVITDDHQVASLINLMNGIEAGMPQGMPGLIPKNAIAPKAWTIFTFWKPTPGDVGIEYIHKVEILLPDGTVFGANEAAFKFETGKTHQVKNEIAGFPIGQTGDVTVKMWLESDRKRIGEVHSWAVKVTHKVG